MRQVFRKIPVYTGDVSGVCSALFELGGMVVMHDPSGCNSTYNTHDEIRWYDHDSLIFLSGLNEMEAVMGSDEALIRDIVDTARIYHPAFIAIANSPIPYIIGMDFDAICRIVEEEAGIPSFYIPTNGMHDYTHGAGLAFLRLAERMIPIPEQPEADRTIPTQGDLFEQKSENLQVGYPEKKEDDPKEIFSEKTGENREKIRCNILGMTPLDFAASSSLATVREKIEKAGLEILSCWAMGDASEDLTSGSSDAGSFHSGSHNHGSFNPCSLDAIRRSAEADVSLVISSTGFPVAQYLWDHFDIPFVVGIPAAGVEKEYFAAVEKAVREKASQFPFQNRDAFCERLRSAEPVSEHDLDKSKTCTYRSGGQELPVSEKQPAGHHICLIGEPVIMTSLAAAVEKKTGAQTHVFGATENSAPFLGPADAALTGEEELERALGRIVEESRVPVGTQAQPGTETQAETGAQRDVEVGASTTGAEPVSVVADPCYADILPDGCDLIRLPHLAFSGRIFVKEIPDLLQWPM